MDVFTQDLLLLGGSLSFDLDLVCRPILHPKRRNRNGVNSRFVHSGFSASFWLGLMDG